MTGFPQDIATKYCEEAFGYLPIETKFVQNSEPVVIKQVIINSIRERHTYRYPQTNGTAKLNGLIKKGKIFKEYINKTMNRTQSELELVQNVLNTIK